MYIFLFMYLFYVFIGVCFRQPLSDEEEEHLNNILNR